MSAANYDMPTRVQVACLEHAKNSTVTHRWGRATVNACINRDWLRRKNEDAPGLYIITPHGLDALKRAKS